LLQPLQLMRVEANIMAIKDAMRAGDHFRSNSARKLGMVFKPVMNKLMRISYENFQRGV